MLPGKSGYGGREQARNRSDHVSRLASIVRGYCVRRHGQDAGGEWYQASHIRLFPGGSPAFGKIAAIRSAAVVRRPTATPHGRYPDLRAPKGSDRSVKIARGLCYRLGDYPGTAVVLQGDRRELEDKVWPDRSRKLFDGSGRS